VTLDLPAGTHLIGVSLFSPIVNQSPIVSFSENDLFFAEDSISLGGEQYYVHVLTGASQGEVASILSHTSDSVETEYPLVVAEGDIIAIREHITLSDITNYSSNSIPDSSNIVFYTIDGTTETYTFASGDWYDGSSFEIANNAIIHPAEGFAFTIGSPVELVMTGNVINADIYTPVGPSFTILSSLSPVGQEDNLSLGQITGVPDNTNITIYSEDGTLTSLDSYIYASGDWYNSSTFEVANDVRISGSRGFVLTPASVSAINLPNPLN
jgi:hypothetical protein